IERPWPEALPPRVAIDCVALLAKPRAVLSLRPPLVNTRPRPEASPPMVVTSWPAKLNLPSAVLWLLPPLVTTLPICAGTSAGSSPHGAGSTAHPGSAELRHQGRRHGRRRIERPMREMGLSARLGRRRTPCTTDSRHDLPAAPNRLARSFIAERPDQVWLADISYISTGECWLYLAAIKDMATRQIVGWSMADHLGAELARDALLMAIRRRQPPPG